MVCPGEAIHPRIYEKQKLDLNCLRHFFFVKKEDTVFDWWGVMDGSGKNWGRDEDDQNTLYKILKELVNFFNDFFQGHK